jgi:hypothetical protein
MQNEMEPGKVEQLPTLQLLPHIRMSDKEAAALKNIPQDVKPYELMFMRIASRKSWKPFERAKNKEIFRQAWNACAYVQGGYLVLSEEEKAAADKRFAMSDEDKAQEEKNRIMREAEQEKEGGR